MIQSICPTIFVIDDDASVQRALARLLHSAEYRVVTLSTVDQFLTLADWPHQACVVADICMSGTDCMLLPKYLAEQGVHYPVILLTAQDTEEYRNAANKAGAVAFFHKPIDDQALIDSIVWSMRENTSHLVCDIQNNEE